MKNGSTLGVGKKLLALKFKKHCSLSWLVCNILQKESSSESFWKFYRPVPASCKNAGGKEKLP